MGVEELCNLRILEIRESGNWGFGDSVIWGLWGFGIMAFKNLVILGFGNLGYEDFLDLEVLEFGVNCHLGILGLGDSSIWGFYEFVIMVFG